MHWDDECILDSSWSDTMFCFIEMLVFCSIFFQRIPHVLWLFEELEGLLRFVPLMTVMLVCNKRIRTI